MPNQSAIAQLIEPSFLEKQQPQVAKSSEECKVVTISCWEDKGGWERLDRAIQNLEEARLNQREEIRKFRSKMAELENSVKKLENSAQVYKNNLGNIGVNQLAHHAKRLSEICDLPKSP